VSYQLAGLDPQPKDIVALESVARQNRYSASCRPVMDPFMPFTVLDRRGSYVLAEYMLQVIARTKVCVRLHRNFVFERQTIFDAATNLALLPVDVALSTPCSRRSHRSCMLAANCSCQLPCQPRWSGGPREPMLSM
jgi:hypothetical protein